MKKVPVKDLITNTACRFFPKRLYVIMKILNGYLQTLFSKCLEKNLGNNYPKPGKDPEQLESYRPIDLL